jgi:DNA-directed RNA polymerase subunit RPC12/RpoP
MKGQFEGEALDDYPDDWGHGFMGGSWSPNNAEEDLSRRRRNKTVVGFGSGHRAGGTPRTVSVTPRTSRSGAVSYAGDAYDNYGHDYGGWGGYSSWSPNKDIELPTPLFMNNYFRMEFTCGNCGKSYNTFSTHPDIEIACVFCQGDGHIEPMEVFEEFSLKEEYFVCPACSLAVDTNGENPVACPKCGGAFDAKLEEGQEEEKTD